VKRLYAVEYNLISIEGMVFGLRSSVLGLELGSFYFVLCNLVIEACGPEKQSTKYQVQRTKFKGPRPNFPAIEKPITRINH